MAWHPRRRHSAPIKFVLGMSQSLCACSLVSVLWPSWSSDWDRVWMSEVISSDAWEENWTKFLKCWVSESQSSRVFQAVMCVVHLCCRLGCDVYSVYIYIYIYIYMYRSWRSYPKWKPSCSPKALVLFDVILRPSACMLSEFWGDTTAAFSVSLHAIWY
jgi:hypothetical protein